MIYLSDEGTLAGLYYGRRRLALEGFPKNRWNRYFRRAWRPPAPARVSLAYRQLPRPFFLWGLPYPGRPWRRRSRPARRRRR